jgi:hypothetical protein
VPASLLAGLAMAVLLMLVATLQREGFFTPLYLIAAPITGADEATISIAAAEAGDPLHYAPGTVMLGALVHLTCSLLFGACSRRWSPGPGWPAPGWWLPVSCTPWP